MNEKIITKIFLKDPTVVFRNISGEYLLVPTKSNMADLDSIYTLSEVSARIWELIDGKNSVAEVSKKIFEEFEVTPDVALADSIEIVTNFIDKGIIKE